ncbi:unnamed protein product, partial [Adineta ricciae]
MSNSTIISLPQPHIDGDHPVPPISKHVKSAGTLSFRNIKYTLGDTFVNDLRRQFCIHSLKPDPPKKILDDVSGIFKSGMNAIMGPTGCGKSSLIDVLADRKDRKGLSGDIFLDGLPISSTYKYMTGYVVQDDIICGTLTIQENIMFAANTRLGSNVPMAERRTRVNRIIDQLGLTHRADTRIGTEFSRGVSGGERKRTCIGMELVLQPKILFLDEPTTGLDASTARNVMKLLSRLSKRGHTIVFSIHQPRYSIFKLFDRVVVMCKGKIVYNDSPHSILPYFLQQGYKRDENDNPADFALDILIEANQNDAVFYKLVRRYQKTPVYQRIPFEIDEQLRIAAATEPPVIMKKNFRKSFAKELFYISKRTLTNTIRNPSLFLSQIVVAIFVGLLIGLVFFDMDKTVDP